MLGSITFVGTLTDVSDKRFKKNIKELYKLLDKIIKLNPVEYDMAYPNTSISHEYGLIAQEVEEIFPQVVYTDNNGIKSISYIQLIPLILQAMKEQQEQIDKLDLRLKYLEENYVN